MAKDPGQEKSLHELRQEVAHSRDRLARDLSGLRYELDFPLKFRKSFQRQTVLWITAAVVIGVVFAVMPARTKKVQVNTKTKSRGEEQKKGILGAGLGGRRAQARRDSAQTGRHAIHLQEDERLRDGSWNGPQIVILF